MKSGRHLIDQVVPMSVLRLIVVTIPQMLSSLCIYIFVFIFFKSEVAVILFWPQYYYHYLTNTYKVHTLCWILLKVFCI